MTLDRRAVICSTPIDLDDHEGNRRISFVDAFNTCGADEVKRVADELRAEGILEEYTPGCLRLTNKGLQIKYRMRS